MKLRLLSTTIIFAVMVMQSKALDQASSGYNADGYTSSGDDDYDANDGSGNEEKAVQQVIDAMKKLNKNKSDDDISKNIKTGARHVMHSIVKKLVTHTGKKVSRKVSKLLAESPDEASPDAQKFALPSEENAPDTTSQSQTVTYSQDGGEPAADEAPDSGVSVRDTASSFNRTAGGSTSTANGEAANENRYKSSYQRNAGSIQVLQNKADAATKKLSENKGGDRVTTTFASNAGNQPLSGVQSVNSRNGISTELGSGSRAMIPQELTPETITANMGRPMENALQKNKKNSKQVRHKKRYRMHRHTQQKNKSRRYSKDSKVIYKNVDKHLIKRGNKRTHTTKRSDGRFAERSSYQAPISNQLESVLNAKATREVSYSREKSNSVQRKRSYPSESRRSQIDDSVDNYDYDYDGSYDETSGAANDYVRGNHRNSQRTIKTKRRKSSKKSRAASSRSSYVKHRMTSKLSKETTAARSTKGNRTMVKQTAKYEAPVRKFKFYGASRNYIRANNTAVVNQGVPILSIESSPTKAAENSDGSGHDDSQIQSGAQVKPAWQNDLAEQPPQYGPVGRSGNDDPSTPTLMVDNSDSGAFPVLLLKPTSAQSDVVVPTSSGRPIVPIIPSEVQNMAMEDENPMASQMGNSSSFVPSEEEGVQNKQPSFDTNSMMEELSSLESRMTVVETAVAEVIEWIRTRGETAFRDQSPNKVSSPALEVGDTSNHPVLSEEKPAIPLEALPSATMPLQRPKVLKQIFIPLPPPNTEAEKEIESGEPVNGLPFPLNFIVSKVLAKMLRNRDHKQISNPLHPHTPLPDINIPAIEHDINRLEMELASVPNPLHHRKHPSMGLVIPDATKGPLINALVTAEPEDEDAGCSSPCENGGICMGNGVCQCPEPFNGPTCGSVTLIKVVKPTRRVFIEDPNNGIIAKLRRRAMSPYLRQIPQQVSDHRDRRRLVHVLKKLLRKIVSENENNGLVRRSELERGIASPHFIAPETYGPTDTFHSTIDS